MQILPFLIFVTFEIFSTVLVVLAQAQWEELSSNAKGFVKSLLTIDQTKRLSSADALRHPWLHQSLSVCPMLGRLQAKIAENRSSMDTDGYFTFITTRPPRTPTMSQKFLKQFFDLCRVGQFFMIEVGT